MNPFAELARPIIDRPGDPLPPEPMPVAQAMAMEERRRDRAMSERLPQIDNPWGLTPPQCYVLERLAEGCVYAEIGEALHLSPKTVATHAERAIKKLRAKNGTHAVVIFDRFRRGLGGEFPSGEVTLRICGGLVVGAEQRVCSANPCAEPFTAKAKGVVAGDGKPCPNDHDPDCRWPEEKAANLARLQAAGVPAPEAPSSDRLHQQIMNLPCKPRDQLYAAPGLASAYKEGHRDARHAAAELVSASRVGEGVAPDTTRLDWMQQHPKASVLGPSGPDDPDWEIATHLGCGSVWGSSLRSALDAAISVKPYPRCDAPPGTAHSSSCPTGVGGKERG